MKKINTVFIKFFLGFIALVCFNVIQAAPEEVASAPESPASTTAEAANVASSRVARLSYIKGDVSFLASGETEWITATRNRPLVKGDGLWTDADAQAILQLDNGTICIAEKTSLTISNLDNNQSQFDQEGGSINIQVRELKEDQTYEVDTPNLALSISQSGGYRIDVDSDQNTTTVSVSSGQADVYGESGNTYTIEAGKAYRFTGKDLGGYEPVEVNPGDFQWCAPQKAAPVSENRYISPNVIGHEDLDKHGTWSYRKGYGNVWQPADVAEDWAPYRDGHWSWVKPWGWTWVADEEWGFAPFHYGRWVYDESWYWAPGAYNVYPVYAPALVVFLGNIALGGNWGPGVGWFPLGFNEIYWPSYATGLNYFVNINIGNTIFNSVYITNVFNQGFRNFRANYVNRRVLNGITVVPARAFAQGRSVRHARVKANKAALGQARITHRPSAKLTHKSIIGQAQKARTQPPAKMKSKGVIKKAAASKHHKVPGQKEHPKGMKQGKVKSPEIQHRPTIKAPARQKREGAGRKAPGQGKVKPHRPVTKIHHPGQKPGVKVPGRGQVKPHSRPAGGYYPGGRSRVRPGHAVPGRGQVKPHSRPAGGYYPGGRSRVRPGHAVPGRGQVKPYGRPAGGYYPGGRSRVRPGHAVPGRGQVKPYGRPAGGYYPGGRFGVRPGRPAQGRPGMTPYYRAPGWQINRPPAQRFHRSPAGARPMHMQRQFRPGGRGYPELRRRF